MTINEFQELAKLNDINRLSKDDLLSILKIEASSIDIQKIIKATAYLREDARFMPSPYREDYIKRFSKAFFCRIKDLKDDKEEYKGEVDVPKLKKFLEVLESQRKQAKSENDECKFRAMRNPIKTSAAKRSTSKLAPTKPVSSAIMEKIKSVCCIGR